MSRFIRPASLGPMRCAPVTSLLRHAALGLAITAGISPLTMNTAIAAPVSAARQIDFAVAPGPLEQALNRLASAAGISISFEPAITQGRQSPGLKGRFTADEALQRVLAGSGLQSVKLDNGGYVLHVSPMAGSTLELGSTTIEGQGMGEMTEGSGSYTTGAVSVGSKTPVSLRYTPQSVSVISHQMIDDKNMTQLQQALRYTPGITLQKTASRGYDFYSRGFNIDNIQIDGAAPMALSSVASGFYSNRMYNLLEFDHVEVLRGSNALFGGVSDPGGTINLVRKRALRDFHLTYEASAGSWDNYHTQLDVTGPLTDSGNVRGRLVTAYGDSQEFVDNMAQENPAVYGVMEVDLTPETTWTVGGMYERVHSNTYLGLPRYSDGSDIGLPRHTGLGQNWSYQDDTSQEIFTKLDHYFTNDWKLNVTYTNTRDGAKSLSGVTGNAVNPVTLTGPVTRGSVNRYWSKQNLLDSNLSGSFDAFGRQHDFVIGADWQRVTSQWKGSGTLSGTGAPVNVFDPGYWSPYPVNYTLSRNYSPNTQEQYGLYSRLTMQVADPLKVIVGGRLQRYHFEQTYTNAGVVQSDVDMREPTRFVPYAGAIYDLDEQWSLYTSYSKIFKPQQSYLKGPVGSGQVVDPLIGKTYEVGLKGELFDGRLNTGVALFYTKRDGGAVLDPSYPQDAVLFGGSCCYVNQGEVISKGVELQAAGELADGWNLMASYVYNNNKDRTEKTALSTVTPKHEVKLWSTYRLPARLSDWTVGGGVNLQSATYASGTAVRVDGDGRVVESGIPFEYTQHGYAVWDALVKYRVDDHWTVSVNGNNLFDKTYYQTTSSSANGNYYGEPRNYMLTLRGEF